MALKLKLDKASYEKLPADVQKEYIADGDDFKLDVEGGLPDDSALKRAKDHEKAQRKTAETRARELQTQLDAITEERDEMLKGNVPKADVAKLEKSYQDKLAAREAELSKELAGLNGQMETMLVDNVATQMASEISTSPALLVPIIKSRLKVEKGEDGKLSTRVVDATGAVSALTPADLRKEIVANKEYAPIITATKASGGGAGGGGGGGGAPAKIDFTKSPKEIAQGLRDSGKIPESTE